MDKVFKISIILAVLLVGFSAFYYYVIFLPQKEETKLELQKQEQSAKEQKEQLDKALLEECLRQAEDEYDKNIKSLMRALEGGLRITSKDLDKIKNEYKETLKVNRDVCFKKYPQK